MDTYFNSSTLSYETSTSEEYIDEFDSPLGEIPILQFPEYFQKFVEENQKGIHKQFMSLDKVKLGDFSVGRLAEHATKNRYRDIVPSNDERVVLNTDEFFSSDYINASYIPGLDHPKEYVACQGPKSDCLSDFYRMILQLKVKTVVMVTGYVEGYTLKCDYYIPENVDEQFELDGDITVELVDIEEHPDFEINTVCVRSPDAEVTFKQFYMGTWADYVTPNSFNGILELRKAVRDWQPHSDTPMVVHCSAGVGRTGTFITIDYNIKRWEKCYRSFRIFDFISKMRTIRPYMVKTVDEFLFVHKVLEEFYKKNIEFQYD